MGKRISQRAHSLMRVSRKSEFNPNASVQRWDPTRTLLILQTIPIQPTTSLMSEIRDSTPNSLEIQLVPPNTMTANVALLSRRLQEIVRTDMRRLAEQLSDPDMARDIVIQALEETMQSLQEEDTEPESTEMENDRAEYVGESAYWTPEQREMARLAARLERLTEVMERRMESVELELAALWMEIEWAEGGRQEGSDGEESVFGP